MRIEISCTDTGQSSDPSTMSGLVGPKRRLQAASGVLRRLLVSLGQLLGTSGRSIPSLREPYGGVLFVSDRQFLLGAATG